MPDRSVKMKRRIFGFQRRVWWPKWTPASRRSRMEATAIEIAPSGWIWAAPDGVVAHRPPRACGARREEPAPAPRLDRRVEGLDAESLATDRERLGGGAPEVRTALEADVIAAFRQVPDDCDPVAPRAGRPVLRPVVRAEPEDVDRLVRELPRRPEGDPECGAASAH